MFRKKDIIDHFEFFIQGLWNAILKKISQHNCEPFKYMLMH